MRRASGPTPGWSSSCGASFSVSVSISRASSRSSTVSCLMRRATSASASSVPRSSGSWRRSGRVAASRAQEPVRGCSGRSSARSGSGVVTSRSRNWQSPARFAFTAPSRAAISARSASRSPLARGVAGRSCASTLRAARTASSASVLPPTRRSRRSRPTSNTRSPVAGQEPSQAGAVRASALDRERTPAWRVLPRRGAARRRSRSLSAATVASNTTTPLRTSTTATRVRRRGAGRHRST